MAEEAFSRKRPAASAESYEAAGLGVSMLDLFEKVKQLRAEKSDLRCQLEEEKLMNKELRGRLQELSGQQNDIAHLRELSASQQRQIARQEQDLAAKQAFLEKVVHEKEQMARHVENVQGAAKRLRATLAQLHHQLEDKPQLALDEDSVPETLRL